MGLRFVYAVATTLLVLLYYLIACVIFAKSIPLVIFFLVSFRASRR